MMANLLKRTFSFEWPPAIIVLSLICGILLSLSHHFFYNSLAGKPTSTNNYSVLGTQYSGQQFNIAVGTTFAFLIKAILTLTISTAFYQVFWRIAKQEFEIKKPLTLEQLDAAFSGIENIFSFFIAPILWCRYPLLSFLAITAWLLPIAFVVAPATLSIELRENIPKASMQHIPQIDFSNLNFAASMPAMNVSMKSYGNPVATLYSYNGPSQIVKQIGAGVVAQKTILPINPPFLNSSWVLDFKAPSLKCSSLSLSESYNIRQNIVQYLTQNYTCIAPATYLAWLLHIDYTDDTFQTTTARPYLNSTAQTAPDSGLTGPGHSSFIGFADPQAIFNGGLDSIGSADAILYIAIMPSMIGVKHDQYGAEMAACNANQLSVTSASPLGTLGHDMTMLQCQVYNSTYHTTFDYRNGKQTISTSLLNQEDDSTLAIINSVTGPTANTSSIKCAKLDESAENSQSNKTNPQVKKCNFDGDLLSQLSYQSVLQAFTMMITGNITLDWNTLGLSDSTNIRSTSLINTNELFYLTDQALSKHFDGGASLQEMISATNMSERSGMTTSRLEENSTFPSLQDALEELFQNFTLSLMSETRLQPDYGSEFAPSKTNVTQYVAETVYVYTVAKLWAAYGFALLFTTISALLGLFTVRINKGSYSNALSTVLRVAQATDLSVDVEEKDRAGRSPLPSYLAKATVFITSRKDQSQVLNAEEDSTDALEESLALQEVLVNAKNHYTNVQEGVEDSPRRSSNVQEESLEMPNSNTVMRDEPGLSSDDNVQNPLLDQPNVFNNGQEIL